MVQVVLQWRKQEVEQAMEVVKERSGKLTCRWAGLRVAVAGVLTVKLWDSPLFD